MDAPVLLTVRGTYQQKTIDDARKVHNSTAGSPQGMEAARSMSDVSHCVFQPAEGAGKLSAAKPGELLFLDFWADPQGLMKFFSNPEVVEQGAKLFSQKDGSVWMPARGGFTFRVPPTAGKLPKIVGLFRVPVKSPEAAIEAFSQMASKALAASRRRGLLSHEMFVRMGAPNDPPEVLGVDTWTSVEGLVAHYSDDKAMQGIGDTFAGAPSPSTWEQATGFNEW